ncbi:isochorismate synthase [Naumannella halotolerans]|uniref:Menaquinone-specific isochorismate synthase n=1 Tax=Naumannella halotolerans TaxID=993414 RepID=A0A4R7JA80_9ACTN|nr:chorismate-binding protein [Naumannella halotolerans]TDT34275.1 menaquinone-specific isochorismate synthase [Naumannella halotolerans]
MSPPFAQLLHWQRGGEPITGSGGWRFAFTGTDRLRRMDRVWQALLSALPYSPTAFVSAAFDDTSALPSVLRLPALLRRDQVELEQSVPSELAAQLLAADPQLRLGEQPSMTAPGSTPTRAQHRLLVERALAAIERDRVRKVVVGRDEFVPADPEVCGRALEALAAAYPDVWTFAVDGLLGATPELLLARTGERFRTRVLAGTAREPGVLVSDERRVSEHRLAADPVLTSLGEVAVLDEVHPEPHLLELPNLWHLATDIAGRVLDPAVSPLALVDRLHPTPAVAGVPQQPAVALIEELEFRDRGRYAGPVGWLDGEGNAEICLALRCGQLEPGGVRLYAAGGIVAGADPEWEYTETEAKLEPMLDALRPGRSDS